MSLLRFCVFLSLPGVRQQIAGTVVGDGKAGREKGGRKSFCKLGKGHRQNALNLSCTIGSLALREQRGGEKFAFRCVRSVLYLIPTHVEPWERAFVLKSSCVYCTFCLPFLFLLWLHPLPHRRHHQRIHKVWFTLLALLIQFKSWGTSATASCLRMNVNWRRFFFYLFGFFFWNSFFQRSSPCGRAARREAGLVISKAVRRTLLHYCNLKM